MRIFDRKMPKKREFSPISDIRPIGQLGRIFGRIISAETGRIFSRIFGIGRILFDLMCNFSLPEKEKMYHLESYFVIKVEHD